MLLEGEGEMSGAMQEQLGRWDHGATNAFESWGAAWGAWPQPCGHLSRMCSCVRPGPSIGHNEIHLE